MRRGQAYSYDPLLSQTVTIHINKEKAGRRAPPGIPANSLIRSRDNLACADEDLPAVLICPEPCDFDSHRLKLL